MACISENITESPEFKKLVDKIGLSETVRDYLENNKIRPLEEIKISKPELFKLDNTGVSRKKSLNRELTEGFLSNLGITVEEFNSLKNDLGFTNSYSAADILTKSLVYEKGQDISLEAAYFAYKLLNKEDSKLKSDLRFTITKWEKFKDRWDYHSTNLRSKEGFIDDKRQWSREVTDLVILDFLREKLHQYYKNPVQFKKDLDTKWTSEDFTVWTKFIRFIENLLRQFGAFQKSDRERLENRGLEIASDILDRNYEHYKLDLPEDFVQKYYTETISKDKLAKEIVDFGTKDLKIIVTGSLILRKVGSVFRAISELLHDIDFVVPFDKVDTPNNSRLLKQVQRYQGPNDDVSNDKALEYIQQMDWFKQFKEKFPSYQVTNGFYGKEHKNDFSSFTVTGVINGEYYTENGSHETTVEYYKKDPKTKAPIKFTEVKNVQHEKGDYIEGTGHVVDFFVRLKPFQEEHENYFLTWKEIMIAKLKMGRAKDLKDWKAFVPFLKSENRYNFNYREYRHINFENNPVDTFEDVFEDTMQEVEDFTVNDELSKNNKFLDELPNEDWKNINNESDNPLDCI
jgi:hypothetical protein